MRRWDEGQYIYLQLLGDVPFVYYDLGTQFIVLVLVLVLFFLYCFLLFGEDKGIIILFLVLSLSFVLSIVSTKMDIYLSRVSTSGLTQSFLVSVPVSGSV